MGVDEDTEQTQLPVYRWEGKLLPSREQLGRSRKGKDVLTRDSAIPFLGIDDWEILKNQEAHTDTFTAALGSLMTKQTHSLRPSAIEWINISLD